MKESIYLGGAFLLIGAAFGAGTPTMTSEEWENQAHVAVTYGDFNRFLVPQAPAGDEETARRLQEEERDKEARELEEAMKASQEAFAQREAFGLFNYVNYMPGQLEEGDEIVEEEPTPVVNPLVDLPANPQDEAHALRIAAEQLMEEARKKEQEAEDAAIALSLQEQERVSLPPAVNPNIEELATAIKLAWGLE